MQHPTKLTPLLRRRQVNTTATTITKNKTNKSTLANYSPKPKPRQNKDLAKYVPKSRQNTDPPLNHLLQEPSSISSPLVKDSLHLDPSFRDCLAPHPSARKGLLVKRRVFLSTQPKLLADLTLSTRRQLLADLTLCTLAVFLAGIVLRTAVELLPPQVEAQEDEDDMSEVELKIQSNSQNNVDEDQKPKKEKVGFRDRKIIDYENRIRAFSTPDKIFRYFASFRSVSDQEIYMTPTDFLRSITPGIKQPDGVGLDQYKKYEPGSTASISSELDLPPGSLFNKLGKKGLISFCDYVFLLTILSTSKRQFEIAFRMFDLNGDGDVDSDEFARVQNIIRATQGRHSKQQTHKQNHSAIFFHFFGEKLDGNLTINQFLHFQTELQGEILRLEFDRKEPEDGKITEKQLAELLLTYANYSVKKRNIVLKRVKRLFKEDSVGVSLEDYKKIFEVLVHIEDIDKALTFHHLAGSSIGPSTLQHVAKVCAGVALSDHLVSVIFVIFDEDGDGSLSKKEFITVMKTTLKRGLDKDETKGISDLFSSIFHCATT